MESLETLQGLGAGAEYSGAILFSAEYNSDRRGFFASWPPAAADFAIAVSAGVFALFKLMPDDQFLALGLAHSVPAQPACCGDHRTPAAVESS